VIKKAFFCIVICAIIAGANGILVKYMSSMSIGIIAWFRAVVPVILVLPYVYKRKNILVKNNYKKMLFISLLCAVRMYMYLFAFKYTSVWNAVIMIYSWPIFVYIISAFIAKDKINLKQIITLGLAFSGLILVYLDKTVGINNYSFTGVILALFSAIIYAIIVYMFKTEIKKI
jgi:drug/metabolite transporter (DMT)-like permease